MFKTVSMITVMLVVCLAGTVLAIDYWGGPPCDTWLRGGEGTTFQLWAFSDQEYFGPEEPFNPFGDPLAEFDPPTGWEWGGGWECPLEMDLYGWVPGWHCSNEAGGSITLTIPNTDDPAGKKWIFLQVTSSKVPSDVTVSGSGGNPAGYTNGSWSTGLPHIQWPPPAPFGGSWYTYNYGRWIEPNPESETITLTFPFCTVVDQIVVDTICTQDPVAVEDSSWSRVKALFR